MKILVVSQHYWPEPFPSTDICEGLVQMGHEVHLITDIPNYPMGYIYPEYKGGKRSTCFLIRNGEWTVMLNTKHNSPDVEIGFNSIEAMNGFFKGKAHELLHNHNHE